MDAFCQKRSCVDTSGDKTDMYGNKCNFYKHYNFYNNSDTNKHYCGERDGTDGFSAQTMCCACGGGIEGFLWNKDAAGVYCENSIASDDDSNQLGCQLKCEVNNACVGIAYGRSKRCFVCLDDDLSTSYAENDFYRKPTGIDITCSTWPTSGKFGCTEDGDSWKSLDSSMDTSRTSACETLCIGQGRDGCCSLGDGIGCYWKGGAKVSSYMYDSKTSISVNCKSAGLEERIHEDSSKAVSEELVQLDDTNDSSESSRKNNRW